MVRRAVTPDDAAAVAGEQRQVLVRIPAAAQAKLERILAFAAAGYLACTFTEGVQRKATELDGDAGCVLSRAAHVEVADRGALAKPTPQVAADQDQARAQLRHEGGRKAHRGLSSEVGTHRRSESSGRHVLPD